MKIKYANLNDKDIIINLFRKADEKSLELARDTAGRWLGKKNKLILIGYVNNKPIGFVGIKQEDDD